MIPFMGVRISWLMVARNSLLARVASKASCWLLSSSALRAASSRRARLHLRFKFSGALEGIERLLFAGVVVDDDAHPFGLVGQRVDRFLPFDQYPPPVPVAVPHPVFVLQPCRRRLRRKSFQTRCARAPRRRDGTRSRKSGSVMCSTPSGQPSIRQTCSL